MVIILYQILASSHTMQQKTSPFAPVQELQSTSPVLQISMKSEEQNLKKIEPFCFACGY